jgi:hypothetical protein
VRERHFAIPARCRGGVDARLQGNAESFGPLGGDRQAENRQRERQQSEARRSGPLAFADASGDMKVRRQGYGSAGGWRESPLYTLEHSHPRGGAVAVARHASMRDRRESTPDADTITPAGSRLGFGYWHWRSTFRAIVVGTDGSDRMTPYRLHAMCASCASCLYYAWGATDREVFSDRGTDADIT